MLLFQGEHETHLLVIDSGYGNHHYAVFYSTLQYLLGDKYPESQISMLLTHVDADHITGFKKLFADERFRKHYPRIAGFYYNTTACMKKAFPDLEKDLDALSEDERIFTGTATSYEQAVTLERLLSENKIPVISNLFSEKRFSLCGDVKFLTLTPTRDGADAYRKWLRNKESTKTAGRTTDYEKSLTTFKGKPFEEDFSSVNASSVSILLEAYGCRMLFLGDAPPRYVSQALQSLGYSEGKKLEADFVKLSHHGSRKSASPELLDLISGKRFLISGDGSPGHPDKECLARVIEAQDCPTFCMNYNISRGIFSSEELKSGKFAIEYGQKWEVQEDGKFTFGCFSPD